MPVLEKRKKAKTKSLGLCCTCVHIKNCMYFKNSDKPIHYCEEFDSGEVVLEVVKKPKKSPEKEEKVYSGLCRNCEHRDTCTFEKPEGGIWHCEEYE